MCMMHDMSVRDNLKTIPCGYEIMCDMSFNIYNVKHLDETRLLGKDQIGV